MKKNNTIITAFSLVLIISSFFVPTFMGLNREAVVILFTFVGILILWLFVSIDWPSILLILILGLLPSIGFKSAIASSFGSTTFMFLFATFLCTHSLTQTNFIKRCAVFFIKTRFAKSSIWGLSIMFFVSVIFVGSFSSPTVLFLVFLPILKELYSFLKIEKGDKVGEMFMVGLAFCTSISSGITPIAHVFSTMAMDFYNTYTGDTITYFDYMSVAIPVSILTFLAMLLIFRVVYKKHIDNMDFKYNIDISIPKMDKLEKTVVFIFLIVVSLWVLPSLTKGIFPEITSVISKMGSAMPPMLGVVMLSIVKIKGQACLNFNDAAKKSIPWSSLVMASSALALGSTFNNKDIGIKDFIMNNLRDVLIGMAPIMVIIIVVAWAGIQTNLSSNIVTVTIVSNVAIPICLSLNNSVNPLPIAILIGLIGSFAFAAPPSMPHIAIAGSSGYVNSKTIFNLGFSLALVAIVLCVAVGYPIGNTL